MAPKKPEPKVAPETIKEPEAVKQPEAKAAGSTVRLEAELNVIRKERDELNARLKAEESTARRIEISG